MKEKQGDIGMVGLGVMGRNMLLNMADHGFLVAGFDKDQSKVASLRQESKQQAVGATVVEDFLAQLKIPRAIMLLVPAGHPVDAVIDELLPHLQKDDLIIDAGNSHFTDTDVRAEKLQKQGICFLGVGVSGGEEGARHGPSIMPGGLESAYERVRPIFEAVAAKVNGEPCVTYLGNGSAGHYVKMVHNGIEYGIMQIIAEAYDFMKRGLGLNNEQLHDVFHAWNNVELNSYLIEITAEIFTKLDKETGAILLDEISDVARQKGTGMWTSQSAMELQVPIPLIDIAVAMRDLSVFAADREAASELYKTANKKLPQQEQKEVLLKLQSAVYIGMIIAYAQGMMLLKIASQKYEYQLNLEEVARIWRGGCIIRSQLLEDIRAGFHANPALSNLLLDSHIAKKIMEHQENLRQIVCQASTLGIPVPGLMSAIGYLDAFRSRRLPANLVQAQRDYFGAHTYERIDRKGIFHTEWQKD